MEEFESSDCTVDLRWMVQGKEREVSVASDTSALKLAETKARRERIATAILGGFLSNDKWKFEPDQTAKAALIFADALIEELDKEEK